MLIQVSYKKKRVFCILERINLVEKRGVRLHMLDKFSQVTIIKGLLEMNYLNNFLHFLLSFLISLVSAKVEGVEYVI